LGVNDRAGMFRAAVREYITSPLFPVKAKRDGARLTTGYYLT